jgi:hypothetical protein
MPTKPPPLTPAIEKTIVAYVRAGGYAHIAAEAAGIPREVFEEWMRKGEAKRSSKMYKHFAEEVRRAEAQARLGAEVAALKDKPMDWLKAGPGKETTVKPGWSALAKPLSGAAKEMHMLMDPGVQRFLAVLLRALEPHPEIRAVVVSVLTELGDGDTPDTS